MSTARKRRRHAGEPERGIALRSRDGGRSAIRGPVPAGGIRQRVDGLATALYRSSSPRSSTRCAGRGSANSPTPLRSASRLTSRVDAGQRHAALPSPGAPAVVPPREPPAAPVSTPAWTNAALTRRVASGDPREEGRTMRLTEQQVRSLYGQDVQDRSGAKIGSVAQVWADAAGEPTWVSVKTGMMGQHEHMAPLTGAGVSEGKVTVPYDKATVKSAPTVEAGTEQPLGSDRLAQLYRHYQLQQQERPPQRMPGSPELTRSEERLRVGTESEPAGTARLSKQVVTENVHTTVPIEHDEVRVIREPITDANRGEIRPDIRDEQREMELRAERPVVGKEQVPVERVRLAKDEIVEEQPIDEQVRRERIDVDVPESARRRG
ncbi:DUF2382 domain-containing protein [Micromonospora sp. KC721]|nr:DUF2382 domain-containing protein [Micromonospora sp. KC721]